MRTLILVLLLVPTLAFAKPAPQAKPSPKPQAPASIGFGSLGGKAPPVSMSEVDQLKLKLLDAEDQRDKLHKLLIQCSNVLANQGLQKLQADKTARDKEREELAKKYHPDKKDKK